jgi:hypothetical protein
MRFLLTLIVALVFPSVVCSQAVFEPEDGVVAGSYSDEYEIAIQNAMIKYLDTYACFKLIAVPTRGNEWAVDVAIKDTKAWVTGVKIGNKIFSQYQKRSPNYEVEKRTRVLDLDLAMRLETLSQLAISEVRYPNTPTFGFDGVVFHFSTWSKDNGFRFGKTWSPSVEDKTYFITNLGRLLLDYTFSEIDILEIHNAIIKGA